MTQPPDPTGLTVPSGAPLAAATGDAPTKDPWWVRPGLVGLLGGTALLYLWDLSASGYGNSFYAAAVQAATRSWKALLFGSLDQGNFITVDKPPASLWLMGLSGRIFGFSSWSMLVPDALCGVGAVALMYALTRRWFGPAAGLLAGAVLALTPVAALMFRYDNPDGVLTFVLVVAAYCLVRALDRASVWWLVGAGAALGLAFLTKMLQGFVVLPAFALVYLVAAPTGLWRRSWQTLVGGAAVVVAAGWWVATVQLWPQGSRPYIGGSTDNSVLNLAFGYNGLGRVFGGSGNRGGGGGGGFGGDRPGWLRLFGDQIGGQVSWLLPGCLVLLVAGLWLTRRAPRVDRSRAALVLWGAWTVITSVTLSLAKGTFHPYYTASIAPGIAGLAAAGTAVLWRERVAVQARAAWVARGALAVAVTISGVWAFVLLGRTSDWYPWLRVVVLVAALGAGLAALTRRALTGRGATVLVGAGLLAVLGGPAAYTAATVTTAQSGGQPTAGPSTRGGGRGTFRLAAGRLTTGQRARAGGTGASGTGASGTNGRTSRGGAAGGGIAAGRVAGSGMGGFAGPGGGGFGGGAATSGQLTALLRGSRGYRWSAAVAGSSTAAGLELATNTSVMAMGGFTGRDPTPTLTRFEQYVRSGQVHYYLAGGQGGTTTGRGGFGRGGGSTSAISSWVEQHFTPLTVGGQTLYDLTRPLPATSPTARRSAAAAAAPAGRES
ncbi:glycosyltransferase family 39 protein [Candidatus Frankia nodulisporulans]|uniref:glycosyltransferase family 39 protein n=1 Tax=Candidatus Frankia nodulisporulans TaxID=2060052 RepID=UPI001582D3E2|nr:glycosyltransferase family 39 protein [Candidatus Frankia nodulisporulans]